jgi:ribonuclease Z
MKMKDRKSRAKKFEGIKSLTIVAFICLALAAPTLGFSADDFKVTLLGTGTPVPSPDTFGPSTLVEAGGQKLVFDLGRGCTIRLWQEQIALGSIDAHFLTHLHSDHINGLPDLYLSGWIQTPFGGRKSPFVIYGPPGTQKMMASLWEAFSEDRRIRLEDEKPLSRWITAI